MKPRIRLMQRAPVFTNKTWICEGFDWSGKYRVVGTGLTPHAAFYNWKAQLSFIF